MALRFLFELFPGTPWEGFHVRQNQTTRTWAKKWGKNQYDRYVEFWVGPLFVQVNLTIYLVDEE